MPPQPAYGQGYGQPQAPYGGRYPAGTAPNGYGAPYPNQPVGYPQNTYPPNAYNGGYAANPTPTMGSVNYNGSNPQASVIAPGMLNPMAPRKAIPTAENTGNIKHCLICLY